MADIDATLEQQIFDLPPREWKAFIHYYREADYLRRTVKLIEGISHRRRLRNAIFQINLICSDKTGWGLSDDHWRGVRFSRVGIVTVGQGNSPAADWDLSNLW